MRQGLAEGGAFAAAGYEDCLGGRVGDQGGVDKHFVVDELVGLRGLGLAIEDEGAAKGKGVDYLDGLVVALTRVNHPRNFAFLVEVVGDGLPKPSGWVPGHLSFFLEQ